jgi:glucose/arabinose dehydrogenase
VRGVLASVGIVRLAAAAAAAALALGLWAGSASGRTNGFVQVASGFSSPVDVRSAPGDPATLYVVEQAGTIKTVRNGAVTGTFLDVRSKVRSGGEQGLLSMAFDPGYAQNHRFYISYTDTNGDSRVVMYTGASATKQLLFVHQPYSNHNGGDLQFDRKGYLYFGLGDGGSEDDPNQTSENLGTKLGKLLRWKAGAGWQMVALGLRNPWRFSFDARNNLWIGDVGQDRYEEIDFRSAARLGRLANYGWSRYEGKSVYSASHRLTRKGDLVGPVWVYPHSQGCSVTGGVVYAGRYWFGDFCNGTIWSFKAGAGGRLSAARKEGTVPSPSSIELGGDGNLYVTSLSGALYELR